MFHHKQIIRTTQACRNASIQKYIKKVIKLEIRFFLITQACKNNKTQDLMKITPQTGYRHCPQYLQILQAINKKLMADKGSRTPLVSVCR